MPEPTYRIESATSFREPEPRTPRGAAKEKPRPKPLHAGTDVVPALAGPDEQEKHELDTLA